MKIDNTQFINTICEWKPNTFYKFSCLCREKDGNIKITAYSGKEIIVKDWFISSEKQLNKHLTDMIMYCDTFNARLYMTIDRKSTIKLINNSIKHLLDLNEQLVNQIINTSDVFDTNNEIGASKLLKTFSSCASKTDTTDHSNKKWLYDIDTKDERIINEIRQFINNQTPEKIIELETKNGFHFIVNRKYDGKIINGKFNIDNLSVCECKDNAMCLLYLNSQN
jgi:hypothetical protein